MSFSLSLSSLEQRQAAGLLRILLIRAGIEPNLGPEEFFCCLIRCNTCHEWSHLKTCSSLKAHREWTTSYVALQHAPCSGTAPPLQLSGYKRTSTALRSSHRQHDSLPARSLPTFIPLQSSSENHPAFPGSSHSLFCVSVLMSLSVFQAAHHT